VPVSLAGNRVENARNRWLYGLSAALLFLVVLVPPLLIGRARGVTRT
jgi:hypothetical protein